VVSKETLTDEARILDDHVLAGNGTRTATGNVLPDGLLAARGLVVAVTVVRGQRLARVRSPAISDRVVGTAAAPVYRTVSGRGLRAETAV